MGYKCYFCPVNGDLTLKVARVESRTCTQSTNRRKHNFKINRLIFLVLDDKIKSSEMLDKYSDFLRNKSKIG